MEAWKKRQKSSAYKGMKGVQKSSYFIFYSCGFNISIALHRFQYTKEKTIWTKVAINFHDWNIPPILLEF